MRCQRAGDRHKGSRGITGTRRNLSMCQLTGMLPPDWGNASAWTNLTTLDLSYNPGIGGGLPDLWGGNASFHSLTTLILRATGLVGGLPLAWGAPGSFRNLSFLDLSDNALEGAPLLPARATISPL